MKWFGHSGHSGYTAGTGHSRRQAGAADAKQLDDAAALAGPIGQCRNAFVHGSARKRQTDGRPEGRVTSDRFPRSRVEERSPLPLAIGVAHSPAVDALPDTLLELMQRNGVGRTVVVHVIYYRWDCRYTADSVAADRDKLSGVCRVDPRKPASGQRLAAMGECRVSWRTPQSGGGTEGDWINDRAPMDPIWNQASELAIPMCVLCPIVRIPDVERVIERYDGRLDVCIDHMADCPIDQPDELKKLLALARFPRVFVKLSHLWSLSREEYPYRDTYDQVKRLYDAFGPQRLMWGTDWPAIDAFCGYGRALELYRNEIKFFNDDDRRWILGKTSLRLWPATA